MLSDSIFAAKWQDMCLVFRHEPDIKTRNLYYAMLSEEMDDYQFQIACDCAIRECRRFPYIADLIALKPQAIKSASYTLPEGAIPSDLPQQHNPVAWATATMALPNKPCFGSLKRRARQILEA